MAKIWPVYDGRTPTRGGPWAELPLGDAVSLLELRQHEFISDLETTPRFGSDDPGALLGYRHVIVEIGRSESRKNGWRPGFYRSSIKPEETFRRILEHAVVSELGRENVIRVELQPTTDSRGEGALRITVVIGAGGTRDIAPEAPLNVAVRVGRSLNQMGDERTPIIEYATEAELAQDAGP